jgi:hypothetical protein
VHSAPDVVDAESPGTATQHAVDAGGDTVSMVVQKESNTGIGGNSTTSRFAARGNTLPRNPGAGPYATHGGENTGRTAAHAGHTDTSTKRQHTLPHDAQTSSKSMQAPPPVNQQEKPIVGKILPEKPNKQETHSGARADLPKHDDNAWKEYEIKMPNQSLWSDLMANKDKSTSQNPPIRKHKT